MIKLGITGNIGSGKSTVAAILAQLGAAIIDADQIGHQIISSTGAGYQAVINAFGKDFLLDNGEFDRRALGSYVFADASGQRSELLNSITHLLIGQEIDRLLEQYNAQGYQLAVVEAALLLEANMQEQLDALWLITAEREQIYSRLAQTGRFSEEEITARIQRQLASSEAAGLVDVVIINDADEQSLRDKVLKEYKKLLKESA